MLGVYSRVLRDCWNDPVSRKTVGELLMAAAIVMMLALATNGIIRTASSYEPHQSPCEYRIPEQKRVCVPDRRSTDD